MFDPKGDPARGASLSSTHPVKGKNHPGMICRLAFESEDNSDRRLQFLAIGKKPRALIT